jgi:hypothetical protein
MPDISDEALMVPLFSSGTIFHSRTTHKRDETHIMKDTRIDPLPHTN